MRFLLVNPWIADFAAYNFWVRPLGLYGVAQWLDAYGAETRLVDCLSPFSAPGKFRRKIVPNPLPKDIALDRSFARYGISVDEFRRRLSEAGPVDGVFVTSVMSYWYPGVIWAVEEIRRHYGDIPIILGGIYATLWTEHARRNIPVDLVCKGPLEANKEAISSFLGLGEERRESRAWYELGLWDGVDYGAIRTALGCPFRCTYCASRMVSGSYRPRDMETVLAEMEFLSRSGVKQVAFYDDALLVDFDARLRPTLEELERRGIHFEFHTPNGLHARMLNRQVARRLVRSGFKSVRLSLETVDPDRQKATGGKVTSRDLEVAIRNLVDEGMSPEGIGVYLLVGLPGQDLDEIAQSITYVKGLGVRPYLAEFSPIPNTVEWERLERQGVVSRDMDPLLTNNSVFYRLFSGYDNDRFLELKRLAST
ncbi:MAG: radical SAM protein [Thermodesulfobacteria bacterium]|nr:radical SAM protein [Thermodesulfobacteriota bacterium]